MAGKLGLVQGQLFEGLVVEGEEQGSTTQAPDPALLPAYLSTILCSDLYVPTEARKPRQPTPMRGRSTGQMLCLAPPVTGCRVLGELRGPSEPNLVKIVSPVVQVCQET